MKKTGVADLIAESDVTNSTVIRIKKHNGKKWKVMIPFG